MYVLSMNKPPVSHATLTLDCGELVAHWRLPAPELLTLLQQLPRPTTMAYQPSTLLVKQLPTAWTQKEQGK